MTVPEAFPMCSYSDKTKQNEKQSVILELGKILFDNLGYIKTFLGKQKLMK